MTDLQLTLSTFAIADYVLIIALIGLLVYNIRIGAKRVLLNIVLLVIFILLASYKPILLTTVSLFDWLASLLGINNTLPVIVSFFSTIIALYALQMLSYVVLRKSKDIYNPCWFNGLLFWPLVLLIIHLVLSTLWAVDLINTTLDISIQHYDYIHLSLYFIIGLGVVLFVKVFNINLYNRANCWFKSFYTYLLKALHQSALLIDSRAKFSFVGLLLCIGLSFIHSVILLSLGFLLIKKMPLLAGFSSTLLTTLAPFSHHGELIIAWLFS